MNFLLARLPELSDQGLLYYGMLLGYSLSVLLFLLLLVLRWWGRRRARLTSVVVPAPHGNLTLTPRAVQDLVHAALAETVEITIRQVEVHAMPGGYSLTVGVELAADYNLKTEKQAMQERVISQLREQVGVEGELRVAFIVSSYAAKSR